MAVPIPWGMFMEAKFFAKQYGAGGDIPNIPYKTLHFNEDERGEVLRFLLIAENCTTVAWGPHSFTTNEGEFHWKIYPPKFSFMNCSGNGAPLFQKSELIDKYEIRSFFLRSKAEIMK